MLKNLIPKIPYPIFVIIFGLLFLLPFLGTFELTAITEGEYSGVAREMVSRGDFISPFFNQTFWADKPPLHLWLLAFAGVLGGWTEFALRIPSVLMTIAVSLMLYHFGRKYFSAKIGLLSSLIFFTCFETMIAGQIILTDMTLTYFIFWSFYSFIDFLHNDRPRRSLWFFYIAMAGAVLTKGLIGMIIPAGGIFIYLLFRRDFTIISRYYKEHLLGFLLFLLLASPWYILEITRHGYTFIDRFFIHFNIKRFTDGLDDTTPWYYYLILTPLILFPWSSFLKPALQSFSRMENKIISYLIGGLSIFVFLFFNFSQTKLHTYLLPLFPMWSLLIAHAWNYFWMQENRKILVFFSGVLVVFSFFALALYIASFNVNGNNVTFLTLPLVLLTALTVIGIFISAYCKIRNEKFYFCMMLFLVLSMNLSIKGIFMPYFQNNYLYLRDFCQVINRHYQPGDKIGVNDPNATNVVFYTQKKVDFNANLNMSTYLNVPERVFVIIPKEKLIPEARVLMEKAGWVLGSNQ